MNRLTATIRFPVVKIVFTVSILLLAASCTVQTQLQTSSEGNLQFIEDFYQADPSPSVVIQRSGHRDQNLNQTYANAEQMTTVDMFSETADNSSATVANIGGEDYATPEEAEEFEVYDELFLFNELNAGETFDPEKMTDSIPVYLISPWSSCYTFPLHYSKVNSDFGWRRSRFHSGIDLDLETGDTVVASFDGIVKKADYNSGYGNLVVIKHFNGLETYYAHLSKIIVKEGDTLFAGDKLGLGGNTGRSTGPHLHYEIRYRGAAIDPKNIIDFKTADIKFEMFYLKKDFFRPSESKSTAGSKYYTVRKGDTLGKIAQRNGTTVSKICKLNGISSKKILRPGMKLRIR